MSSDRYARLSTGERYGASGYVGNYTTGTDTEGESGGEERTQRRTKRKTLKSQLEDGRGGSLLDAPRSARNGPRLVFSYYKGIPTKRGSRPGWQPDNSGVPTRSPAGVGYWYPNHKVDDDDREVTIWFYYDQADGPYPELRFGAKFPTVEGGPTAFWVRRKNNADGTKMTVKDAEKAGLDFDHPDTNKERVRHVQLGFRFITDLKVKNTGKFDRRSNASSAASSRGVSPVRFDSRPAQSSLSYAGATGGGTQRVRFDSRNSSANSSARHSRAGSPTGDRIDFLADQLSALTELVTKTLASQNVPEKAPKKNKKDKETRLPEGSSLRGLYRLPLSGGVAPEEFYGVPGVSTISNEIAAQILPARHYMLHNLRVDIVKGRVFFLIDIHRDMTTAEERDNIEQFVALNGGGDDNSIHSDGVNGFTTTDEALFEEDFGYKDDDKVRVEDVQEVPAAVPDQIVKTEVKVASPKLISAKAPATKNPAPQQQRSERKNTKTLQVPASEVNIIVTEALKQEITPAAKLDTPFGDGTASLFSNASVGDATASVSKRTIGTKLSETPTKSL